MPALSEQSLQTCNKKSVSLTDIEIDCLLKELNDWQLVVEQKLPKIMKSYHFKDFISATHFANKIAALAEIENHHPRICIEWGKVNIGWWTHSPGGLFINDFIMAARCDKTYRELI
ncbi:MAG: 4a-hydroxytetrahydrobiopterin dehydratase [Gammaproteobacteria bacterium]|nr:4a-hydroxytetrahydrobiopterin dehydratase [Gammaproteobacteria bacterium]